jgi:dTDP-4-amino-4,6-dideoxygalactose transaminase
MKDAVNHWPCYTEEEIAAVAEVLRSGRVNYWTGEQGRLFEREFAEHCGTKYAVAVANGSVALELALYALGIGPGDEVIVPSRTFIASASCVMVRGATPVFADVDANSQNLTAETVAAVLTPRTRAIIAVHLAGWPCEMDDLLALARKHSLFVIEDCAQAHGAAYQGRRVGSLGHIAAFSFCQDKIITTGGEGGMVTTNDREIWERVWSYKDHGRNYEASHAVPGAGFRWIHDSIGTNFRLTEMQSVIGRIQLRNLDRQLAKRQFNAALLTEYFKRIPGLRLTIPPAGTEHAYYKYYTFVEAAQCSPASSRDLVLDQLSRCGVSCSAGSCSEVYLERAFPENVRPRRRFSNAKRLGETSLMFSVHPTLPVAQLRSTCEKVAQVMSEVFQPAWAAAD